MAAIVSIKEWNGTVGSQSATDKSGDTVRFKSADNAVVDTNDPVTRPNVGVNRSYEKWLRLSIDDLDDASQISNLEMYVAGHAIAGIAILAKASDTYCEAEGNEEADPNAPLPGGRLSAGAMTGDKANIFNYTKNSPLSLGEGPYTENIDDGVPSAGVGKYLVLQAEVYPTAKEGPLTPFSLVIRYDEE